MADDVAATFGPEPGATLTATAATLHLKGNRGDFLLPLAAVVSIGRGGFYPWLFKGVRIRHRIAGFPKNLQFLDPATSSRDLLRQLGSLGYPVR